MGIFTEDFINKQAAIHPARADVARAVNAATNNVEFAEGMLADLFDEACWVKARQSAVRRGLGGALLARAYPPVPAFGGEK